MKKIIKLDDFYIEVSVKQSGASFRSSSRILPNRERKLLIETEELDKVQTYRRVSFAKVIKRNGKR